MSFERKKATNVNSIPVCVLNMAALHFECISAGVLPSTLYTYHLRILVHSQLE